MGQYAHDMMRQEFKDNHGFDIGELNDSPGRQSGNRPKDRTALTRKAQERQRKRDSGLRPAEVWIPAGLSTAEVQKHVAKLREPAK